MDFPTEGPIDAPIDAPLFGVGIFFAIFILVAGLIFLSFVVIVSMGLAQWSRNNRSPLVTVPATVVSKRQRVDAGSRDTSSTTAYFVTFELPSGERREMAIRGSHFGLLVERDQGQLTFQGTRFKNFTRAMPPQ